MVAEYREYKGKPVIALREFESARAFAFGFTKAKLIVEHIDEINQFVEYCEKSGNERE